MVGYYSNTSPETAQLFVAIHQWLDRTGHQPETQYPIKIKLDISSCAAPPRSLGTGLWLLEVPQLFGPLPDLWLRKLTLRRCLRITNWVASGPRSVKTYDSQNNVLIAIHTIGMDHLYQKSRSIDFRDFKIKQCTWFSSTFIQLRDFKIKQFIWFDLR